MENCAGQLEGRDKRFRPQMLENSTVTGQVNLKLPELLQKMGIHAIDLPGSQQIPLRGLVKHLLDNGRLRGSFCIGESEVGEPLLDCPHQRLFKGHR